ncbi:Receptor-type tyrosine-protein phosphatase R [Nymphon striatum]|nr:Receptor-type tyrosine-protein phosphatase R [Nymphon striatum]
MPEANVRLSSAVVDADNPDITMLEIMKNNFSRSWELSFIVACCAAIFITFIIMLILLMYRNKTKRVALDPEIPESKHIVYQPVVKPRLREANLVQPAPLEKIHCQPPQQVIDVIPPYAVRLKAKGLLERRGSNASLTLDLNPSNEYAQCGTPPRECNAHEYLQSAGNRMTLKQLRNCLKDIKALHREFWEIPLNHREKIIIPGSGHKNRYKTIIPNEETRVILPQVHNDVLDTYINANYIRGYDGEEKVYIATQGPMSHTIPDFWTMIWNEKVPIIVMITKHKEDHKVKCEPYIPDHMGMYDNITVTVTKFTPKDGYSIRELLLQFGNESKKVLHFWYTAWPDHKTPSTGKQLLMMATDVEMMRRKFGDSQTVDLLQQDNELSTSPKGPVVVHCSAGIGRTGCFIGVSVGMQQIMEENMVDILGLVCQMRLDRGGMVQTAEQYEFVHQALYLFERTLPDNTPE